MAARTSAFRFRGEDVDIREIGEKLNVRTVLKGSVRKPGNRLRLTAQLINIRRLPHLVRAVDREMRDIFDIQDEIARAIVDQLRVELVGPKDQTLVSSLHGEPGGVQRVSRGTLLLEQPHAGRVGEESRTVSEGHRARSVVCSRPRLVVDPLREPSLLGDVAPREVVPKARAAAERALELDDNLGRLTAISPPLAHRLGFPRGRTGVQEAFRAGPGAASGRTNYSLPRLSGTERGGGQGGETQCEARPALQLDRRVGGRRSCTRWGVVEEAIDTSRRAIAMDPGHWQLYFHSGVGYLRASMEKEATAALNKSSFPRSAVASSPSRRGGSPRRDEDTAANGLDPWRSLYEYIDRLLERSHRVQGAAAHAAIKLESGSSFTLSIASLTASSFRPRQPRKSAYTVRPKAAPGSSSKHFLNSRSAARNPSRRASGCWRAGREQRRGCRRARAPFRRRPALWVSTRSAPHFPRTPGSRSAGPAMRGARRTRGRARWLSDTARGSSPILPA